MSTKNLARTAAELGRMGEGRYEPRWLNRSLRVAERSYCRALTIDPELYERRPPPKVRRAEHVRHDKWHPVERWMESQVGRPWAEVHADLRRHFADVNCPVHLRVRNQLLEQVFGSGAAKQWSLEGRPVADWFIDSSGYLQRTG